MADQLEFYQDAREEWRWRRTASNGEIIGASSEGYKNRADAEANANRDNPNDKWEFYEDAKGEHRWRRKAGNGQIVGKATEGYKSKSSCVENAKRNGYKG
ncbi:MAG: DUF1508 domain-containing protein [Calditrichaeota bacterium]|nr:DUF1508 domain-containing protein [Calditrichota bacterium]